MLTSAQMNAVEGSVRLELAMKRNQSINPITDNRQHRPDVAMKFIIMNE